MQFTDLQLHESILKAITQSGYDSPTEVQAAAIPPALAGQDLMVSAATGSGKTASFVLPSLEKILAARGDSTKRREKGVIYGPRILVLCPTRELAMQVAKNADTYGRHVAGLRVATVVGGVPYPAQIKALRGPLDILISTPGRLIDHLQSGKAVLDHVETLVLDEADRMLDMGFIEDIETIASHLPAGRQTLMYSATFAGHVGQLAKNLLRDPQRVEVASHTDTHENIEQRLHWADNTHHKNDLLDRLLTQKELEQAVVFTSTQRDADWLADRLAEQGHHVASLHGGMPQGRRNRVLQGLRNKQLRVLVATDVAARGIDVPTISHVINYGLPMKAEDYVHRIGRTGRAGRNGVAVTLAERMDAGMIRRIQQFTTQAIPVSQLEGLEPKSPEPRIYMDRKDGPREGLGGGFGGRGKPFPSRGKFGGGDRGFAPRHDAPRFSDRPEGRFERPEGRFERRADAPVFERRDNPFAGRGDRPQRDFAPRAPHLDRPFEHRSEGRFEPHRPERAGGRRDGGFSGDRGYAPRGEGHPGGGFKAGFGKSGGFKPAGGPHGHGGGFKARPGKFSR